MENDTGTIPNNPPNDSPHDTVNDIKDIKKDVKPWLFKAGNKEAIKRKKKDKVFSLRDDLLDSLKKLKTKSPKQYWELINSYWLDPKMRGFLMETIEGKATQRVEQIGSLNNPVRVIQVKELNIQAPTMPQNARLQGKTG